MPVKIDGDAAGKITRAKIAGLGVPSISAASISRGSTSRTPSTVLRSIGKNVPSAISAIVAGGPRPKRIIVSGSHAVTGMGRKNCSVGSTRPRTRRLRPRMSPSGIATIIATKKPLNTRMMLAMALAANAPLYVSLRMPPNA